MMGYLTKRLALLMGLMHLAVMHATIPPCFKADFDPFFLASTAYGPLSDPSEIKKRYAFNWLIECVKDNEICAATYYEGGVAWVEQKHFNAPAMKEFSDDIGIDLLVAQFRDEKTGVEHCVTVFRDTGKTCPNSYERTDIFEHHIVKSKLDTELIEIPIDLSRLRRFILWSMTIKPKKDRVELFLKDKQEKYIKFD